MLPAASPMPSRDRAQQKTLWRLLLAAVQVACVLVWASTASAEELAGDPEASFGGGTPPWTSAPVEPGTAEPGLLEPGTAEPGTAVKAGGRAVGMCGTSAQSIAAPPPIYPGTDAAAKPCTRPGEQFRVGVPRLPKDAPVTVDLQPEKSAVLPPTVLFPQRLTLPARLGRSLDCPGEEHRTRAERPPQR